MIRWNWKWYVLREAVVHWELWLPIWDDGLDIACQLTERMHHMLCKARIIRRAHR